MKKKQKRKTFMNPKQGGHLIIVFVVTPWEYSWIDRSSGNKMDHCQHKKDDVTAQKPRRLQLLLKPPPR